MAKNYEAVLGIVDRWSAPILKMEESLHRLGAVGEATNKMMTPHQKLYSNFMEDLNGLSERFGKVSESIGEMGSRITELMGPLAAIGAVGSLAGLVEMTHSFAEATEQLGIGAKIAGATVQSMQALNYAAKQTGVGTDALQHSLGLLNRNLGLAGSGKDKDLVGLLNHLHISLKGANGQFLSGVQLLPQLADAFSKTTDPAMAALMATQLFGRSGMEILPLLDKGSAGLAEYAESFKKYGYVLSGQDVAGAEKFNESWKNMQAAVGGLTDEISAKLAPVMAPIIQQMAIWTSKNRDWIASGLHDALVSVDNSLKKIDFKSVMKAMDTFGSDTLAVINAVGGMKTAMIVTGLVVTGPFLAAMVTVTSAVAGLTYAIGAPIVGGLYELGATMVDVIPMISSMSDAMAAFDLVLDANPIGVMIAALGAFGFAGYELYEHWAAVSKFLSNTWATISTDFTAGWAPQKGLLEQNMAEAWKYLGGWQGISNDLSAAWHYVDTEFHAVFDPIMNTINEFESKLQALESDIGIPSSSSPPSSAGGPRASRQRLAVDTGGFSDLLGGGSGTPTLAIDITHNNAPPGTKLIAKSRNGAPMPKISTGKTSMAGGE